MEITCTMICHRLVFELLPTMTIVHPQEGVWIVDVGIGNYTIDLQFTI